MTSERWMLAVCFSLISVLGTVESHFSSNALTTAETQTYTCRTFGSGIVQPFNGSIFYVRSSCQFTLTRFTHNRVECDITIRRGNNGLLVQVEIIINKIRTVLQVGSILVEKKSVSLPYDHTYQHIFQYGIYTKLKSSLLPLSVTWHDVPGGIDTLWVDLDQQLSTDMTGLCGKHNVPGNNQQLIVESEFFDNTCHTLDPVSAVNQVCILFFSYTLGCLQARTVHYLQLCQENIYNYEMNEYVSCAFFKEVAQQCGDSMFVWNVWRSVTKCEEPGCPGELVYVEQGAAFVPSCSNPNPRLSNQDHISSCVCPMGTVLNDHVDGFHCVSVSSCPCVFGGKSYSPGDIRSTKCQTCVCDSGKWQCLENVCPTRCLIEGQFVTSFDGKQFVVPGKCTYVSSQGLNWTVTIEFSKTAPSLKRVILQLFQETYTFSYNMVKIGEEEITELHQSDHALVFWQSSMYVQVHTTIGMKIQVQMSHEIQLYITLATYHTSVISGLCGNNNNDTTDDFTTSSGIVENTPQPFALSWSVDACAVNIPSTCISIDNEIFADEKCSVLKDPTGTFAKCHGHISPDYYHTACIQRTCNCGSSLQQCLCVSLGSYAKACASLGAVVGDWRTATNCTLICQNNQEFFYNVQACNRTCRSLSGPDPRCGLDEAPVEGCGCPEGTHLNQGHICTPKAECVCHYYGGTTPPGPVAVDGRHCVCENGELKCSKDCGCRNGKVCVHCAEYPINTAQKTCDSLSKQVVTSTTCDSGCHCPHDQYEDHHGYCVSLDNCTCVYSGKVFSAGQHVKTTCKTCICGQGQWHCIDERCPGKCQVYGNGHYQTFDSKWYQFDGHCQYTLVEDDCGKRNGTFSIRVETVPCCDEERTCSRSIILDLQDTVTLTLSDMRVTKRHHDGWSLQADSLYSTYTVGLYIIVSVPSRGITLIWDKHTRITIELHEHWRNQVCGLCGNFDTSEMNDLQISGSKVVSSPLAFGNSWKATTPPCPDVTTEIFPCERNSYCSAWAQRRCMILTGDTFKDCHLKVDPQPYYHACVQESCSCEFEGKFLGFCTALAAYAEACSNQDVCIKWRTPDLCPVYCDYYNEQGQCSWHYEACGEMLTCSERNYIPHKLEGCYPRCSKETPYYDENTGECTTLKNCTCYFNDTIIQPRAMVLIQSIECRCENGTIRCLPPTPPPTTIRTTTATSASTTIETTVPSTTTSPTTTTSITTETWSTTPPTTTATSASTTIETTVPSTTTSPTTTTSITAETWSTTPPTTSTPITSVPTTTETTEPSTTTSPTTTTSITAETWSTTPATTSTPITSVPTTTETTVPSTTTSPTTTTSITAETWSTTPPTTSTPITSVPTTTETTAPSTTTSPTTTTSITAETWSTTSPTTSTPITSVPTTTETTAPSTTTSPTTTTSITAETWSTTPPTTSTPITSVPTTTETTEPSTTTSPTTTMTTAASTQFTTIIDSTESTTVQTTTTEFTTPESPSTVLSTLYTSPSTLYTNTSTTWTTETAISTTQPTSKYTEPTSTLPPTTTFATISAQTSGPIKGTTTEPSTNTFTSSQHSTTQPTTTTSDVTTSHGVTSKLTTMPQTAYTTEMSTNEEFTVETATTELTTSHSTPQTLCECKDLKRKKSWSCGETWTEDCFHNTCTNKTIELTPVVCPESAIPICPRNQVTRVSDGCCETWKCDCRCELFGDPHYISFQGVTFDFLADCTYILVEERSPRHHLTIAVDNFYCVPGLQGSCAKGVILKYQNNTARLSIIPSLFTLQATLNNVTIVPPYEENGWRFETTGYIMSISLPEIRSYVSLSPAWILVVSLAMEHFLNNTQGQCGVCGVGSCVRKGGQMEDDSCCEKTAYDWVYADPLKPACASAPRDVPCHDETTPVPTSIATATTSCPASSLCELLHHPVFSDCSQHVNLILKKRSCEFDSCRNGACSSLEQAADECRKAGFCVDWRRLTNGSCDVLCPKELIYQECRAKLDDCCHGGVFYPGASLKDYSSGCFCPGGRFRAGNHSNTCVSDCKYCKGPLGEPRRPGEVWQSGCYLCTCNNQTSTEECFRKRPVIPTCSPNAVLVNNSCCGDQICVEKTCSHHGKTYMVGDKWKDAAYPCMSFSCSKEGVQTETRGCPTEFCEEEDRIWDDQHCCFTCKRSCAPQMTSVNLTIDNCTTVMRMPVCQGQCVSEPWIVLFGDLQVEHKHKCCKERSSERRLMTLQCSDLTTRQYTYNHITGCECRACFKLP